MNMIALLNRVRPETRPAFVRSSGFSPALPRSPSLALNAQDTPDVSALPPPATLEEASARLRQTQEALAEAQARISRLEGLALTDELTGLMNRQGFMRSLRREIAACRRHEKQAGLLVLADVDDFSDVRALYGAEVGETYLQNVGAVLMDEVRLTDHVARLHGDCFAALLPLIAMRAAGPRLDALERALNGRVMHHREHAIPLRASFGFAVLSETETPESLLSTAEAKLGASKARRKMGMRG